MTTWFDESRLDDEAVLAAHDHLLRPLAESGARVRRALAEAAEELDAAARAGSQLERPRAVVALGRDSRLLRVVLEPVCPVPFVAWTGPSLPGWAGSLDLVVVLAPGGEDPATAAAVAEAVRRGCQVVVACPPNSRVAEHAGGRWTRVLPERTGDPLATATLVLEHLAAIGLGPRVRPDEVAQVLDDVAVACSPRRDLSTNPAKILAISLADATPVLWGGSSLAARAARRFAEAVRRSTGRTSVAGEVDQLLPILDNARPRTVFDDPFADGSAEARPVLVVLGDGRDPELSVAQRQQLVGVANSRGVRVDLLVAETGSDLARYASLTVQGQYAAAYLGLGLAQD